MAGLVLMVCGCAATTSSRAINAPANNSFETVGWYLEHIQMLADTGGAPPSWGQKQHIYEGMAALSEARHRSHTPLHSWVRVQSAYRHAVEGRWSGVIAKLTTDTEVADLTWYAFFPSPAPVGWSKTYTELLDEIEGNLDAGGHLPADPAGMLRRMLIQNAVAYRKSNSYINHSDDEEWLHAYLAWSYSQVAMNAVNTAVVWSICELLHDL